MGSKVQLDKKFAIGVIATLVCAGVSIVPIHRHLACNSATTRIQKEGVVGKTLWSSYQHLWREHENAPTDTTLYNGVIVALINLFQSDQKMYSLALKNEECFSGEKVAWVREQSSGTQTVILNLRKWINSEQIFDQDYYPEYIDFSQGALKQNLVPNIQPI